MARSDSFQKKWASAPSQFERPADALIDRGWAGGAAEDPPEAKWENWWHNRVDEALAEIESNGAMAWFADVSYAVGAIVRNGGKNWLAAIASTGIQPGSGSDVGHWQELNLAIATKAEAEESSEANANNVKRMTPLRVLQAIKARLNNATETVAGMLRIATQAEVNAGVLDNVAVTPKKLKQRLAGLPFTKEAVSGPQDYVTAGLITFAHGLGVKPKTIETRLVCVSGNLGWVVGDEVYIHNTISDGGGVNSAFGIYADATNIYIRIGSAVAQLCNKTTGANTALAAASWKIVIRGFA